MKKIISIAEIVFLLGFTLWVVYTAHRLPDRIFWLLLEVSAVFLYHLYEKFKNIL